MRLPRRPRTLSGEEARLWAEIAKLITPLRARGEPKRALAAPPSTETRRPDPSAVPRPAERPGPAGRPAPAHPVGPMPDTAAKGPGKSPGKGPAKRPVKLGDLAPSPAAPPRPFTVASPARPPGLERRERQGLRRGTLAIEARIDLHGLRQADAHATLVGFLMRARAEGQARVLVVTGKGSEEAFSERGVLRRSVPHWLRGPDLRGLVLGFEEAGRQHGGAGALYVRLRRR